MKRLLSVLTMLVLSLILLQACSGGGGGASGTDSAVIDISHDGNTGFTFGLNGDDQVKRFQTFTADSHQSITGIDVKIRKNAEGDYNSVTVQLYDVDGNNKPFNLLAQSTIDTGSTGTSFTVVSAPFIYHGLTAGKSYAIVLGQSSTGSNFNTSGYEWCVKEVSPDYYFGKYNGTAWIDESGFGDGWLRVHVDNSSGDNATISSIKLPKTGQTTSYATGDDGALQKGVVWPSPRFTDNSDGTITDRLTGLMWLKDANCIKTQYPGYDAGATSGDGSAGDGRVTWQHALDFIVEINNGIYSRCGGEHNDWRLPNRNELHSLIDHANTNTALSTGFPFLNIDVYPYWSSTTSSSNPGFANLLDIGFGSIPAYDKNSSYSVWPVRDGDSTIPALVHLPQTGQLTSYYGGDDGAVKKGVAWPVPRFGASSDATITDNLTGLIWAPDGNVMTARDNNWDQDGTLNDGKVTWQHALDYVTKLNAERYLGHNDWRLPNVNELQTLVHAGYRQEDCGGTCTSIASWLNVKGFINVQPDRYWSSTTLGGGNSTWAWFVEMTNGLVNNSEKTTTNNLYYLVWPVRGVQ